MVTRILLVDDHALMREGLRAILQADPEFEVVGEASDGRQALEMVTRLQPDVVIMDIGMPHLNGFEATRQIGTFAASARVIALSTHNDKRYVLAMLESGARGYVVKSSVSDELRRAIQTVQRNQIYLSPEIAGVVVESYLGREYPDEGIGAALLGSREREVLQLLAEGKSSPEIASVMHISVSTVETHRRNIMRKLDIHSVAGLTKFAIREGLTEL
ncbi:MAG TPA: response regulator transcription factor [Candidatus Kapabacteria bacterium]|jgi:two-component system NarL family response regulator|nr:response regulator transcription factor [Candidatus Kapabacteria bacterium]